MSDHPILRRIARANLAILSRLFKIYLRSLQVDVLETDGRRISLDDHRFGLEIYAASERDLIALAPVLLRTSITTLVSDGEDGDWITSVLQRLGSEVVRGSTLHSPAAAALLLIRALRASDHPAMVVVDGPVGPAGVAREGVGACAAASARPIVAAATAARRKIVFRGAWSQIYAPLPFTRVVIALEGPLNAGRQLDRPELSEVATNVTALISKATERAGRSLRPEYQAARLVES